MARKRLGPIKIVVHERAADWHAQVDGRPEMWGCGRTSLAAIGDVVASHAAWFGVEIARGAIVIATLAPVIGRITPAAPVTLDHDTLVSLPAIPDAELVAAARGFVPLTHPLANVRAALSVDERDEVERRMRFDVTNPTHRRMRHTDHLTADAAKYVRARLVAGDHRRVVTTTETP